MTTCRRSLFNEQSIIYVSKCSANRTPLLFVPVAPGRSFVYFFFLYTYCIRFLLFFLLSIINVKKKGIFFFLHLFRTDLLWDLKIIINKRICCGSRRKWVDFFKINKRNVRFMYFSRLSNVILYICHKIRDYYNVSRFDTRSRNLFMRALYGGRIVYTTITFCVWRRRVKSQRGDYVVRAA